MDDVGKVPRSFLETHVLGRLGAARPDVRLGPTHGVDFGLIDVGEQVVAIATDPLFVPLSLGPERGAWYGFHAAIADIALSGLAPSHLSVTLMLPPTATGDALEPVWRVIDEEARALDAAIVTGHTGRYEGCDWPYVGAITGLAVGEASRVVRPDGARPGDVVLVTNGPAVETVGVLATQFGTALPVDPETAQVAAERFEEIAVVEDALTAAATGAVTAMHDATERGIDNALHELAAASDVRLDVTRDDVPWGPGVEAVCSALEIDPWTASSEGTLLLAVDPDHVDRVLAVLQAGGTRVAAVGRVHEGSGVVADGEAVPEPDTDPFWAAYTRLAGEPREE
ncbi:MAG: AIR synthase-related protein [Halodesulfurarchaeum sp.]